MPGDERRPRLSPPASPPVNDPRHDDDAHARLPLDGRLSDWRDWLDLSTTPTVASRSDALTGWQIRDGILDTPSEWPKDTRERVYVAFDATGAVYVGQTTQPLAVRIRRHFANQTSEQQRHKAGTWQLVTAAAFVDLRPGDIDRLERSAAQWLLPLLHRSGRRHPRPRTT